MDLVASYDSEVEEVSDSEGFGKSNLKSQKHASQAAKCYDVIEIDSDTGDETTTPSDNTMPSTDSSQARQCSVEQVCIDITQEAQNMLTNKTVSVKTESSEKNSGKQIKLNDYLNLENSDSDEDIPPAPADKVTSLINSASELNEVPCGPKKPCAEDLRKRDSSNQLININIPCSSTESTFSGNIAEQPENTQIKIENKASKQLSDLYKEDERVLEASRKNTVCRIPKKIVQTHAAHSNIIMSLNWCIPQYSHLFLSASLDGSLKIWDLYHRNPVQLINVGSGLSAAKWSLDGGQVVTGGFSKKAYVFDVQTGKRLIEYKIYNFINSIEVHPYMEDVFLCGTRNAILGFDIRVNTEFPIRSFFSNCKEVLDIAFLDENEFVCSSNIVSHDSENRTIMVWDFSSGALLSNQIYMEKFTCPSLKVHPSDSSFVAQTNGDYIAAFSTTRPYKIKNKKYAGHSVSGYSIECDISSDGKYLVSGDSNGHIFFYNYANTTVVHKPLIKRNCPTNKIKWHPAFSNIIISSTYDGQLQIWK